MCLLHFLYLTGYMRMHLSIHMQHVLVRSLCNAPSDRILHKVRDLIDPEASNRCNVTYADVLYEIFNITMWTFHEELGLQVIMIWFLFTNWATSELPIVTAGTHISAQDHPTATPGLSDGDRWLIPYCLQHPPTGPHKTTPGPSIQRACIFSSPACHFRSWIYSLQAIPSRNG